MTDQERMARYNEAKERVKDAVLTCPMCRNGVDRSICEACEATGAVGPRWNARGGAGRRERETR